MKFSFTTGPTDRLTLGLVELALQQKLYIFSVILLCLLSNCDHSPPRSKCVHKVKTSRHELMDLELLVSAVPILADAWDLWLSWLDVLNKNVGSKLKW